MRHGHLIEPYDYLGEKGGKKLVAARRSPTYYPVIDRYYKVKYPQYLKLVSSLVC